MITPTSVDGPKPRAPSPEGLLVAEGVGLDPEDGDATEEDPEDDVELEPVALACEVGCREQENSRRLEI